MCTCDYVCMTQTLLQWTICQDGVDDVRVNVPVNLLLPDRLRAG